MGGRSSSFRSGSGVGNKSGTVLSFEPNKILGRGTNNTYLSILGRSANKKSPMEYGHISSGAVDGKKYTFYPNLGPTKTFYDLIDAKGYAKNYIQKQLKKR